MTKLLIGLLGAVVLGTGGYAAAAGLDDAEPALTRAASTPRTWIGSSRWTLPTTTGGST